MVDLPADALDTGASEAPFVPPSIAPNARLNGSLGFLRAMIADPVSAIPASAYEEPLTVLSFSGGPFIFVSDPDVLEQVLVKRSQEFPKSKVDKRIFQPAFGDSLLIAHGEDWKWKRRLAAPHFSPAALAKSVPGMIAPFEELAREWRSRNSEDPVDVSPAMTRATLDVISSTLFTDENEIDATAISEAISDYLTPISWTIALASFNVPAWLPHPGKGRIRQGQRRMRLLVEELIERRRGSSTSYSDICADLMNARDPETDRLLSDRDVADMLLTLVAAGHETSANGLTWALYCLASQPRLQEELRAEVQSVTGDRPIAADNIPELVHVEAFLKETMRLFPPAPLLGRRTDKAETIGGRDYPTRTALFIPIYAVHRHRLLWKSPERFDPTRFLGDKAKEIRRTAYMPFGAGPRICIGGTFAMMEMVGAMATLLKELRFSTTSATRCEPMQRVTLRPKDKLELAVAPL